MSNEQITGLLDRVKQIYGPLAGFAEAKSYFEKLHKLKNYYLQNEDEIIRISKTNLARTLDSYPVKWSSLFTPIERQAWESMRIYGTTMYPQYPVLDYFVDFANPLLKIIVELDGKQFHEKERDEIRDKHLLSKGWKVYRITGREMYRTNYYTLTDMYQEGLEMHDVWDKLEYWINETGDGVIRAIYEVYYHGEPASDEETSRFDFYYLCKESLESHRLIK